MREMSAEEIKCWKEIIGGLILFQEIIGGQILLQDLLTM